MLIYLLLIGALGGCAFWVFLAFKLIFKYKSKRKIKTKAEFKKETKKYEAPPALDIQNNKGGKKA